MITLAFVGSSLLVITMPGPDLALITRLVLTRGRLRPAVAAAAGMITAGAVQVTVGALGLAVLLATRPTLFTAFRWAGAAVLLGMAALALRSALRSPAPGAASPHPGAVPGPDPPAGRAFWLGLLCTGSNPKVGLFLMAFLPQFVPPGAEPTTAVAVLAAVYLGLGLLWLLVWMNAVSRVATLVPGPTVARIADLLTGVVFTYFGLRLFLG